jgi:outer membrane protein TolC
MSKCYRTVHSISRFRLIFFVLSLGWLACHCAAGREITLDDAIGMAVDRTPRGDIIKGREEVAQQNYYARRINFLVPEISINGELPSYSNDESYRFFGADPSKSLYKTRDLDFNSFIELKQNILLTGGTLTATANLNRLDRRYPDTRFISDSGLFVDELSSRGFFNFTLEQQLFRPSAAKNELENKRDEAQIATLTRHDDQATLTKEVIDAYVGMLQMQLKKELYGDKLRSARVQAEIDSLKLIDGVVSEEDFLLSASARLDAELESFEIENQARDVQRDLAMLLDIDITEDIQLVEPQVEEHLDDQRQERLLSSWERSVPIQKAELEYDMAKRNAEFAAAGHGITGDLRANYSFGRQNVETERFNPTENNRVSQDDNIKTQGWTLMLQVRYPLWDGGAGAAAVKAARFEAEQARLEWESEQRDARNAINNLVNQLDVSYRRLGIIHKQIDLAKENLDIARGRYEDGSISELTYLESEIFLLETKDKYLDELKMYLTNQTELQATFLDGWDQKS